jgi:hypothetical protein
VYGPPEESTPQVRKFAPVKKADLPMKKVAVRPSLQPRPQTPPGPRPTNIPAPDHPWRRSGDVFPLGRVGRAG